MKLIRGLKHLTKTLNGCVMTIGNFDGVHLGHQAVIQQVKRLADEKQVSSLVMIFEPQPLEFFAKSKAPKRLNRLHEKTLAMQLLDIDYLFCVSFNEAFSQLSGQQFVLDYLVTALNVKHLVVGDDFCFGKNRSGTYDLLLKMSKQHGFTVQNTSTIEKKNERISSTKIRQMIVAGQFQQAAQLLGHPYMLSGKICHGKKLGRDIGFPTINIKIGDIPVIVEGIFAVRVKGLDNDGSESAINGVASIGTRPTVNGEGVLLEVYLFDFNRDVYGKTASVEFLKHIRSEQEFISIDVLIENIQQDVKIAQDFFHKNPSPSGRKG